MGKLRIRERYFPSEKVLHEEKNKNKQTKTSVPLDKADLVAKLIIIR